MVDVVEIYILHKIFPQSKLCQVCVIKNKLVSWCPINLWSNDRVSVMRHVWHSVTVLQSCHVSDWRETWPTHYQMSHLITNHKSANYSYTLSYSDLRACFMLIFPQLSDITQKLFLIALHNHISFSAAKAGQGRLIYVCPSVCLSVITSFLAAKAAQEMLMSVCLSVCLSVWHQTW